MTSMAGARALTGVWPRVNIILDLSGRRMGFARRGIGRAILDLGGRSKGPAQCGLKRTPFVSSAAVAMALPGVWPRMGITLDPSGRCMGSAQRGLEKPHQQRQRQLQGLCLMRGFWQPSS